MPGAIVKPGGGTGGASTFSQVGGDPSENAALVTFVTAKAAAAAAANAPAGGIASIGAAPDKNSVDLSGNASIAAIAQVAANAQAAANNKLGASGVKTVGGQSIVGTGDIPLPAGGATPLVNDLTSGGTNAALTAEQGKTLATAVANNAAALQNLAVAGGALPTPTPFNVSVAFDAARDMGTLFPEGQAYVFTPNAASAVTGATNSVTVIPDGTTLPDITTNFKLFSGSDAYDQSKIMVAAFECRNGFFFAGWSAFPGPFPPTTRPVVTAAANGPNALSLSFTASAGASSYQAQFKKTSESAWVNAGSPVTVLVAAIAGLTAATSYDVRVVPKNAFGPGPMSAPVTVATATSVPGALSIVDLGTGNDDVNLTTFSTGGWRSLQANASNTECANTAGFNNILGPQFVNGKRVSGGSGSGVVTYTDNANQYGPTDGSGRNQCAGFATDGDGSLAGSVYYLIPAPTTPGTKVRVRVYSYWGNNIYGVRASLSDDSAPAVQVMIPQYQWKDYDIAFNASASSSLLKLEVFWGPGVNTGGPAVQFIAIH